MRTPLFFPVQLDYCNELQTPEEVLTELQKHSLEDMLMFFEACCEDETWTHEFGGPYLKKIFDWMTKEFLEGRLPLEIARRAAAAVQQHPLSMQPLITEDIRFKIDGIVEPANSLLFGSSTQFFRDLIQREAVENKAEQIPLQGLNHPLFQMIKEFLYTGTIELLWKSEASEVLTLLRKSSELDIAALTNYTGWVYKRYLDRENVLEILQIAVKEGLETLKQGCCEFLSHQNLGVKFIADKPSQLSVELFSVNEEGWDILGRIVKFITHVTCHGSTVEKSELVLFLRRFTRLIGLNLSQSPNINPELLDSLPEVAELDLTACYWLNDDALIKIIERCPQISRLILAENAQLTYRSWGALTHAQRLSGIDLNESRNFGDDELDLLLTSCPGLSSLSLAGCTKITSKHMNQIGKRCRGMKELNLSSCRMIGEQGFIDLALNCPSLQELDVSYCGGITEDALNQIIQNLGGLKHLNLKGCFISEDSVAQHLKDRPSLQIET
jgi:hypothetical protein